MSFSARLEGLQAFGEALSEIAAPDDVRHALEAAAAEVRDAAAARLQGEQPPESGTAALAASLTADPAPDGMSVTVGTPLDHGWQLEFGSLARPAAPWLEPALQDAQPAILAGLKSRLANPGKRPAD